ncbi:IclR family transcriptional regulator [Geminicoccaceae bacterium 1502E]|nr:IclR family transcriptional regulator [Geminicoccaceae bacterium 1502E]
MDKTLLKGLQVLEHLVRSDMPMRSTDVAGDLDLTRSNAHRVLKTLEAAGYIRQDPRSREFAPSLKLWEMGATVIGRLDLRQRAADILRGLAQETGEAVHLSVLDKTEVIYIDKIDSPQPVGAYTRIGGRAPAFCVATGKAILAYLDEVPLQPVLKCLEQHSGHTIVAPDELLADLRATRERGYSINRGEWRSSVWGIAAAVRDAGGSVIAAVGVSGPDFRLSDRCGELGAIVTRAATAISRELGYNGAPGQRSGAGAAPHRSDGRR